MDLLKIGSQLLAKQLGSDVSEDSAGNALIGLLGDGNGGLDIAGLVSQFAGNGALGSIIGSWLSDNGNQSIDPSQLFEMFGSDKLSAFASNLGLNQEIANGALSLVLPKLIDKSSTGGSLFESVGGLSGALGIAKKFF